MPELPEVETTRRGLEPLVTDRKIISVHIYKKNLRWDIPSHLKRTLKNQIINKISRRAKYLLFHFESGELVMHLGMSGSISVINSFQPLRKHEHFELKLDNTQSKEINVGLVHRYNMQNKVILGGYTYFNHRRGGQITLFI